MSALKHSISVKVEVTPLKVNGLCEFYNHAETQIHFHLFYYPRRNGTKFADSPHVLS